jgi:hypothetical protein
MTAQFDNYSNEKIILYLQDYLWYYKIASFGKVLTQGAKIDGFGGLVVSMLASGTRVRGFKPGRSRGFFRYMKKTCESERICPKSQLCGM